MLASQSIPKYYKASKAQEDYLAWLYPRAGEVNASLYSHYTMLRATKEIGRLERKVERQSRPKQLVLL